MHDLARPPEQRLGLKILFFMTHPGFTRNFESTLALLAERGHRVQLAFDGPPQTGKPSAVDGLVVSSHGMSSASPMRAHDGSRSAWIEVGVDSFESSFGELGGCPVPPGATGNVASEDLVSMLHEMRIETGINLEKLLEAARAAQEVLGRPLGSHTLVAGPVDWRQEQRFHPSPPQSEEKAGNDAKETGR